MSKRSGAAAEPDPWMDTLAWLLDSSIGIGRWRIGLDGLLGLLPGVGDVTGTALSAVIIARAALAGVPRATLARMMLNVAADSLFGSIPLAGDLFDFAFKSNLRNMRLYREAMAGRRSARRDWAFLALALLLLMALMTIPVLALIWLAGRRTGVE